MPGLPRCLAVLAASHPQFAAAGRQWRWFPFTSWDWCLWSELDSTHHVHPNAGRAGCSLDATVQQRRLRQRLGSSVLYDKVEPFCTYFVNIVYNSGLHWLKFTIWPSARVKWTLQCSIWVKCPSVTLFLWSTVNERKILMPRNRPLIALSQIDWVRVSEVMLLWEGSTRSVGAYNLVVCIARGGRSSPSGSMITIKTPTRELLIHSFRFCGSFVCKLSLPCNQNPLKSHVLLCYLRSHLLKYKRKFSFYTPIIFCLS